VLGDAEQPRQPEMPELLDLDGTRQMMVQHKGAPFHFATISATAQQQGVPPFSA
jgi:hypothetical protein